MDGIRYHGVVRALLVVPLLLSACVFDGATETPRCRPGTTPVTVVSSEVVDHYVRLDLQFAGGCAEHAVAVWWTGVGAPSNPPLIPLELQHYDGGDRCEALLSESIWIDVSPVHRAGGPSARLNFVMGTGGSDGQLATIEYPFDGPAAPPVADVIEIDESCGVIGS